MTDREGNREEDRVFITPQEQGGSVTTRPGTGSGITSLMSAQEGAYRTGENKENNSTDKPESKVQNPKSKPSPKSLKVKPTVGKSIFGLWAVIKISWVTHHIAGCATHPQLFSLLLLAGLLLEPTPG